MDKPSPVLDRTGPGQLPGAWQLNMFISCVL